MRLRSIGVAVLGLLLAGIGNAWAQVSTTGTIQVIVEDPQGGRLPGVAVTASAPDVVTNRQAVTDAEISRTGSALFVAVTTISAFSSSVVVGASCAIAADAAMEPKRIERPMNFVKDETVGFCMQFLPSQITK